MEKHPYFKEGQSIVLKTLNTIFVILNMFINDVFSDWLTSSEIIVFHSVYIILFFSYTYRGTRQNTCNSFWSTYTILKARVSYLLDTSFLSEIFFFCALY